MSKNQNHISREEWQKYIAGEMRGNEAWEFERKLLDRKFETEALEGMEEVDAPSFKLDMDKLESRLEERVSSVPAGKPWYRNPYVGRIAAAITVLAVSGYLIYNFVEFTPGTMDAIVQAEPANDELKEPTVISDSIETIQDSIPQETITDAVAEIIPEDKPIDSDSIVSESADLLAASGAGLSDSSQFTESFTSEEFIAEADEEEPLEEELDAITLDTLAEDITFSELEVAQAITKEEDSKIDNQAKRKSLSAPASRSAQEVSPIARMMTGKVYAEDESDPLPGVSVAVKGKNKGTLTDLAGNYSLEVDEEDILVFSYIGFSSKEAAAEDQDKMDVTLKTDVASLQEVVVTGYSYSGEGEQEVVELGAKPESGYPDFRRHIRENLQYPEQASANNIAGRVVVQFTVNSDGSLSNFRIKKGLGYGCDEEAIRLIQTGPAWQPSTHGDLSITEEVRVTIRFK